MPNTLLKLLLKDKPLYSGKVHGRREMKTPRRETEDNLQQTRTNQHAKLAVETQRDITLQHRSTNQREWLVVETPEERELRLEC